MYKIMTPGPTQVAENVRLARSRECTNPDLDASFVDFTKKPVKRSAVFSIPTTKLLFLAEKESSDWRPPALL